MFPVPDLPSIEISLAPGLEAYKEPFSPFQTIVFDDKRDDDSFRPTYLSPPPVISPSAMTRSSPLNPTTHQSGKGINQEKFDMLLKSSREASVQKRALDLRREVALKAQRSKQLERRARFLSKIEQPPSPTAAQLPVTPPESPALFHYTLPSPGLVSPLRVFETIVQSPPSVRSAIKSSSWVEQVDFRLPSQQREDKRKPRSRPMPIIASKTSKMPSLDEISAHLNATSDACKTPTRSSQRRAPLPAFLSRPTSPPLTDSSSRSSLLPIGGGPPSLDHPRLQGRRFSLPPPPSPSETILPKLEVTTTLIPAHCSPRFSSSPKPQLTEANLLALNSRARMAHDMLTTLRRRLPAAARTCVNDDNSDDDDDGRRGRRISAPAEMTKSGERKGFQHPVSAFPGGF